MLLVRMLCLTHKTPDRGTRTRASGKNMGGCLRWAPGLPRAPHQDQAPAAAQVEPQFPAGWLPGAGHADQTQVHERRCALPDIQRAYRRRAATAPVLTGSRKHPG